MGIKSIKSAETAKAVDASFYLQSMIKIRKQPFTKYYKLLKTLGTGTYGQVFEALHLPTGHRRAIKKINVMTYPHAKVIASVEISLLKILDHPSILKIYEVFEQGEYEYIVTEYCEGRQLFDILLAKHYFPEEEACFIFYEALSAVRAMHDKNIMHRDLKPENIIYDEQKKHLTIIDFGSGVRFDSSEVKPRKRVGTSYYIAPQVLTRNYNQKCDIWSLGVILYMLLVGEPPFQGSDDFDVMKAIVRGDPLRFRSHRWKSISQSAKDLITKMLDRNVSQRPTATELMEDQWFIESLKLGAVQQSAMKSHLQNMQIYRKIQTTPLQEGMLIFIVNFIQDKTDQDKIARSFKTIDLNGDGVIGLNQLTQALAFYIGIDPAKALTLAKQIFSKVDLNHSGYIDFSQFMMCVSSLQLTLGEENLDIAFDYMDRDKNGRLSVKQIRQKLGNNIAEDVYNRLVQKFDKDNRGEICRQKFKAMMKMLVKSIKT